MLQEPKSVNGGDPLLFGAIVLVVQRPKELLGMETPNHT